MGAFDTLVSTFASLLRNEEQLLSNISYTFIGLAVCIVFALQFVGAPYGRYASSSWGFPIPAKTAWFLQELPSFSIPILLLFMSSCPRIQYVPNKVLFVLFLLHYFQRAFIFSLLIRGGKATPLIPFVMALSYCVSNGYLQGCHLLKYNNLGHDWPSTPSFYLGIALFFIGMLINIKSDSVLRNLRSPQEKSYKIPQGGMFEYISGANFFGEIMEWWGFALAAWSLPAFAFAFFATANLGPRACSHHKWYLKKFEDYPKSRKALIPFIL